MGVINKATSKTSGKSYIGQTINLKDRMRSHRTAKDDYPFHAALRKYGFDDFEWTVIEDLGDNCSQELLDKREKYWIQYFNTYNNGYNSTLGGDNAHSLVNWIKTHKEENYKYALNGLYYANKYWEEHSEERMERILEIQKIAAQKTCKKVKCIELNLVFNSISEAEKWSMTDKNPKGQKCSHQHISKVCSGQRHTCGGYHWTYV